MGDLACSQPARVVGDPYLRALLDDAALVEFGELLGHTAAEAPITVALHKMPWHITFDSVGRFAGCITIGQQVGYWRLTP